MFDLSFYELIKWALNYEDNANEYLHKTITYEIKKYVRFSLLVWRLTRKEDTNLSNISRYMDGYVEYFIK